jgi:parvulin-like peptidyl-prolyl isomerase
MQTIVNGETIAPEWIEEEFSQIKAWHEQRSQLSCCERDDEFRAQARDNVIGRVLLNQAAEKEVPDPTNEQIQEAVKQLHQDYGGEEAFLATMGLNEDQKSFVDRQVVVNLKVDQLIAEFSKDIQNPGDDELIAYYKEHPEPYTSESRVRALHIFKSLRQSEDKDQLFKECCQVRERLVSGEDFETIAKEFSDKPAEEIDLGFFKRGELMDEFEFVAFSMRVGEVSPVFSSYHGFHLAKVLEIEPPVVTPFDEVRETVQEAWMQEKKTIRIQECIQELKSKAEIKDIEEESEPEPAKGN